MSGPLSSRVPGGASATRLCGRQHRTGPAASAAISDGPAIAIQRTGAASAPASVVYLSDARTAGSCWRPVTERLHRLLDGRIAQIECEGIGSGEIDEMLARVNAQGGSIVLVAHCAAALPILRRARDGGELPSAVAGIVLLNPLLETGPAGTADDPASGERLRLGLRRIPTWTVTGQRDPYAHPERCHGFAESIWGDHDIVAGAGHLLPLENPRAASEPILAALEVAYRTQRVGAELC